MRNGVSPRPGRRGSGSGVTPGRSRPGDVVEARAPILDEREVIDSGGHRTRRIFLSTRLRLAGIEREIEINLSDRRGMLFPMLLGPHRHRGRVHGRSRTVFRPRQTAPPPAGTPA